MMSNQNEFNSSYSDEFEEIDPYQVLPSVTVESSIVRRILVWVARVGLAAAAIGLVSYGSYQFWYLRQINPTGIAAVATVFTVTENDDLETISRRLEQSGVIVHDGVFRSYVAQEGGLEITPGLYTVRARDHLGNILRVLRTPPNETLTRVTFPEGFTLEQMASRLAETTTSITAGAFIEKAGGNSGTESAVRSAYQPEGVTTLEGLLFPDTYFVAGDETPTQVVQRMVRLMERVGRQEGLDDAQNLVGYSPYQVLIVASIIEREAKVADDRAKIARVIYNRLFLDMPLQVDATLYYGQNRELPFSQLREIDTPFNTYLYKGLPPTPIANPGRASIAAAL
ncbi:MAG: hypothetical protein RL119_330, partial [Actinomycetota bacterium]